MKNAGLKIVEILDIIAGNFLANPDQRVIDSETEGVGELSEGQPAQPGRPVNEYADAVEYLRVSHRVGFFVPLERLRNRSCSMDQDSEALALDLEEE